MSGEAEVRRHVHVWLTIGEWAGYRMRCLPEDEDRTNREDVGSMTTQADIARIAEVVIGLGVAAVKGCKLCDRDDIPCPKHVGEEIARQVWPLWAS